MTARNQQKKLMTIAAWPAGEVSTRNCRHCLAPVDGIYVSCRKGHAMVTSSGRHRRPLSYNGVLKASRLLRPCQGCKDFNNDWS